MLFGHFWWSFDISINYQQKYIFSLHEKTNQVIFKLYIFYKKFVWFSHISFFNVFRNYSSTPYKKCVHQIFFRYAVSQKTKWTSFIPVKCKRIEQISFQLFACQFEKICEPNSWLFLFLCWTWLVIT